MRYIWKRCFAALLAVALVFVLLPGTARAEEADGTAEDIIVQEVQALIDALPGADTITADNRADVEAQLAAIDEAKLALTADRRSSLDVTRYDAAVSALSALNGQAGDDVPTPLADSGFTYEVSGSTLTITGSGELTASDLPQDKDKIQTVIINGEVTSIGESCFEDWTNLQSITLPETLQTIGRSAFEDCDSLSLTELPAGVTSIETWAFYSCDSLALIELPAGLESIGSQAFCNCGSLTLVELPSGLKSIDRNAFQQCNGLTHLTLPASLESMGSLVFYDCDNLTSLTFLGENAPTIEGMPSTFVGANGLKEILYPQGAIGYDNVDWPEGVTVKTGNRITVQQADHGSASASSTLAAQGTQITLTAVPDAGYHLKGWTINQGVEVTGNVFAMPENDVTVTPMFEAHKIKAGGKCETCGYTIFEGSGTEGDPFLIPDLATLEAFRDYINADNMNGRGEYFKLTSNIDMSAKYGEGKGSWTPIGLTVAPKQFRGHFDGDNHVIKGLYISAPNKGYQGLFSYIVNGSVKNLGVEGTIIGGGQNVGGIAGDISNTTIENCYNSASVTNSGTATGGIVGYNTGKCTIKNCYNTGEITGGRNPGGISGINSGLILNCYNTAPIHGTSSNAGGITGYCADENETVGQQKNQYHGKIINCYNTGKVTAPESPYTLLGGIAASWKKGCTVTNCYFLTGTAKKGVAQANSTDSTEKSEAEFVSGEVAYLLSQREDAEPWGQTIGTDNYPILSSNKVYKVTFSTKSNANYAAGYANYNGTVALPANPTLTGMIFDHWSTTDQIDGLKFTDQTLVTADTTVYAVGRQTFGGGIDEPLSVHVGYSSTYCIDLDMFMAYHSDEPATGKFEYIIASDPNDTKAFLNDSTLNIPAGLEPGTYKITVTATEKAPAYSLMSVESYGVEPVTMTVQFDIIPHYSTSGKWMIDEATGQHYKVCSVCNKDFERFSHSWTLQSTDETTGDKTYSCDTCGAEKVVEEGKYCVSGKVLESDETTPSGGTQVTLKRGGETVAESVTDSDGSYSFPGVEPGIYDLVVGEGDNTTTVLVEVTGDGKLDNITELPEHVSSVLEVTGDDTPAVIVGGLDDEARGSEETGKAVTVTMTVEAVTDGAEGNSVPVQTAIDAIKSASASSEHEFLDLALEKTVSEAGKAEVTTDITETKNLITVVIPFDPSGKSNIVVYRYHNSDVDTLTESKNGSGEYIEITDEAVTIHAKNFSVYAIGYTIQTTPTSYSVTAPKTEHGTVTADRRYAVRGRRVTLTAQADEGYHLASLTVTYRNGRPVELTDNGDGTWTFVQPAGRVTVTAEFVPCLSLSFTDLDTGAWYHDYTDYVIAHGLMQGIGGGLFEPSGTVSRAQMVTVLWNMSDKPVVNYYMNYSDVSEDAWYAEAIRWATSEGIAAGYDNGKFGPGDPITREQMAVMLYRYEQKIGDGGFTGDWMYRLPFADLDLVSDWAFESVAWCNMEGIITGKDDNVFDPKGPAKRSEMAAILTRYCGEETGEE